MSNPKNEGTACLTRKGANYYHRHCLPLPSDNVKLVNIRFDSHNLPTILNGGARGECQWPLRQVARAGCRSTEVSDDMEATARGGCAARVGIMQWTFYRIPHS
jgi:hypothetical protein